MSRKLLLFILSLSLLLPLSTTIGNVNGTWYVRGWIGKYVSIGHIAIDTMEFKINETATFEIFLQNWETVFVKTINVTIKVGDAKYNETLAKDCNWIKPSNALAGAIYSLVKLTPKKGGFVSLYIHADYQYNDGDQMLEQEGTFELQNFAWVVRHTYSDFQGENMNLRNEISGLDSKIQDLNASYLTLEKWAYFLAFTTCALIVGTIIVVIFYKRKLRISSKMK